MERRSTFLEGVCASVTFDSRGRIETVCVGVEGPKLLLLDPRTLETLAALPLPPRQPGGGNLFTDFAGGGYFYLDNRDRAVIPTTIAARLRGAADRRAGFAIERDYDLSTVVLPGDKIISALPDWSGRLWFASTNGRGRDRRPEDRRGPLAAAGGEDRQLVRGRGHGRGLHRQRRRALPVRRLARAALPATVLAQALRQLGRAEAGPVERRLGHDADADGRRPGRHHRQRGPDERARLPARLGRADLPAAGLREGRERDRPVADRHRPLAGGREQLRLLRARPRPRAARRPRPGSSASTSTPAAAATRPGARRSARRRWCRSCRPATASSTRTRRTRSPRTPTPGTSPRSTSRSGRTVYKRLGGEGLGFNNNYAPVTLGPDGTAYVGTLGGLVALRDKTPPPGAAAVRRVERRRSCAGSGCTCGGWVASARGCG